MAALTNAALESIFFNKNWGGQWEKETILF